MRTTTRRRSRLRSSHYASERWRPSPSVAVVTIGLILGLAFGFRGRLTDRTTQVQQDYMLLVSDLYFQGSPLASVRDRLLKIGFPDASLAVVGAADQLSSSSDTVKQQEAGQLHQFAEALASGVDRNAAAVAPVQAIPTAQPVPTTVAFPTVAAAADAGVSAVQPPAIPTDVAVATPVASAAVVAPSAAQASSAAAAPVTGAHTGVIRSTDQKPVFLRKDPSTKAKAVASMPYGAAVTIKATVQGTAVDPGNTTWYRVMYGATDGYVYSSLVQVGG